MALPNCVEFVFNVRYLTCLLLETLAFDWLGIATSAGGLLTVFDGDRFKSSSSVRSIVLSNDGLLTVEATGGLS